MLLWLLPNGVTTHFEHRLYKSTLSVKFFPIHIRPITVLVPQGWTKGGLRQAGPCQRLSRPLMPLTSASVIDYNLTINANASRRWFCNGPWRCLAVPIVSIAPNSTGEVAFVDPYPPTRTSLGCLSVHISMLFSPHAGRGGVGTVGCMYYVVAWMRRNKEI